MRDGRGGLPPAAAKVHQIGVSMQEPKYPEEADITRTGMAGEEPSHPVAVLSAVLAALGREERGESRAEFAARAEVGVDLVRGIEEGSCPAWSTTAPEIFRVAGAMYPDSAAWFWTAANCDLLLSLVLSDDMATASVAADELLSDPEERQTARVLLLWAVRGIVALPAWDGSRAPLLPPADLNLLRARAADLAGPGTDAAVSVALVTLLTDLFPQAMGKMP